MTERAFGLFVEFAVFVAGNNLLDTFVGNEKVADGSVMVKGIDDVGDVLTHVAVDVPFTGEKFG